MGVEEGHTRGVQFPFCHGTFSGAEKIIPKCSGRLRLVRHLLKIYTNATRSIQMNTAKPRSIFPGLSKFEGGGVSWKGDAAVTGSGEFKSHKRNLTEGIINHHWEKYVAVMNHESNKLCHEAPFCSGMDGPSVD